jgi:hypothetical protein
MRERPWKLDLTGQRFGKWTVIRIVPEMGKYGERYWLCKCECGSEKPVQAAGLRNGKSTSCGCIKHNFKHGLNETPTYGVWSRMMLRCYNENYPAFKYYGDRGIEVCSRWHDFLLFLEDVGEKPNDMSLGRIDNNGNYEPSNCRWETSKQQVRNRSNSIVVRFEGKEVASAELAERFGMKPRALAARLRAGYPPEQAVLPRNALRTIAQQARRQKEKKR